MSTPVIIGILCVGMFVLVAIAVTMQSIEKNKKEQKLLEGNLNNRARNFEHMQEFFPENFLSRDLQILLNKCIQDAYEQLAAVNPSNSTYKNRLSQYQQQLKQLQEKSADHTPLKLTDSEQIREIQKMLNTLYKFVSRLTEDGRLGSKEALAYGGQIRHLMLLSTTDGLDRATADAKHLGKYKLALHNTQMALEKMEKENTGGQYTDKIKAYQQQIQEIKELAGIAQEESEKRREEYDEEWEEASKPDESWKKNNVYD